MKTTFKYIILFIVATAGSCGKKSSDTPPPPAPPEDLSLNSWSVNGVASFTQYRGISRTPVIRFSFSGPVDRNTVTAAFSLKEKKSGNNVNYTIGYEKSDSTVVIQPVQLESITGYKVAVNNQLKSANGGKFNGAQEVAFNTLVDPADKFPQISEDSLLTLVQKQTFKYFWDFGHPVSGLARERNTSGETVTSGGSGFGIMALVAAVNRGFISRADGLARMQKIVGFLKNTAQRFHGVFPHWLNGTTGAVVPFSAKDNGADLVETSFLMQGLLTARQYFDGAGADETTLRNDINSIWNAVEWDWFRRANENILFWHWSPNFNWEMNLPIKGWNECLITYVLAASSTTHAIPKLTYDSGFAGNGGFANGSTYYGFMLPLGPAVGGPLFFSHYSFLGINPNQLTDAYAGYWTQNKNHTLINNSYCITNPGSWYGYSDSCWGLTASDDINGYKAHSPTNDNGVITPTAALSAFPYTPVESMKALKYFYYKLGDKIWGNYGFYDAFSLHEPWFATSTLAIDQGPIIVMIENYRSGLLWNLFMSCPEVKTGMTTLGFQGPNL